MSDGTDQGTTTIDIRGSLFCEVRETSLQPLCTFYVSAISGVLKLFGIDAEAKVTECRAAGGRRGCVLSVALAGRSNDSAVAA